MLKRVFSLLLCAVMAASLVACNNNGTDNTVDASEGTQTSATDSDSTVSSQNTQTDTDSASSTQAVTQTDTNTDTGDSTETKPQDGPLLYNDEISHLYFATDTKNSAITIYDLDYCDGDWSFLEKDFCVVWEWESKKDKNCKYKSIIGNGITAAKLRNSPVYGEVVVTCSTGGWVGLIDYEERTVVYETSVTGGPHDIEMLPNGDLAVIGSGGELHYICLSSGNSKESCFTLKTTGGHGVCWDPKQECLWILEDYTLSCIKVDGYGTSDIELLYVEGKGIDFEADDYAGHVLSPMWGDPGKYWFTATDAVWIFDSLANTYEKAPDFYQCEWGKGIAYFEDGTMIQTPGGMGTGDYDWYSKGFRLVTYQEVAGSNGTQSEPVVSEIISSTRSFYKVFPVTKEYQ